ncbi:MAG: signal peptidase I, partial [Parcubacteria group bacterium SW_6_46_9]
SDPHNQETTDTNRSGFVWELIRTGLLVLLIVLPVRIFIAQPFVVSGASMEPTLSSGDYLIIDQLSYRFEKPQRHDVAVFRYPNNPSKFYIKRIIGLPGETIEISDGDITIINENNPDGFAVTEPYLAAGSTFSDDFSVTLDEDEYFVLGDNRDSSADSRTWGALPKRFLVGHAFLQLLPVSEAAFSPGDVSTARGP